MRMSELAESPTPRCPDYRTDQAPRAAPACPPGTRPGRRPVHQRDPHPSRAAVADRQRTRSRRHGPRAGDRRSHPGPAATAMHRVRADPATNRHQRRIAGHRRSNEPSRGLVALVPMPWRMRPAGRARIREWPAGWCNFAAALAGRPHEATGNGSPGWMAAGPRERLHRTPAYRAGSPAA